MEMRWYWPPYVDFLRRLGTQARLIMFDRRGSGSSERASGDPLSPWEQWADDTRAVLDAVGSERAVLLGLADGGPVAICSRPVTRTVHEGWSSSTLPRRSPAQATPRSSPRGIPDARPSGGPGVHRASVGDASHGRARLSRRGS